MNKWLAGERITQLRHPTWLMTGLFLARSAQAKLP